MNLDESNAVIAELRIMRDLWFEKAMRAKMRHDKEKMWACLRVSKVYTETLMKNHGVLA